MTQSRRLIVETDGASRGNPGLAGAGIIIKDERGRRVESIKRFLGVATNNQAEYQGLIAGLEAVARYEPEATTVRMDSELVIKQMNGQYRVRSPELMQLYVTAQALASQLPNITFVYIPREKNPGADRLANVAIDTRGLRVGGD
jgi:ribonuclease HI